MPPGSVSFRMSRHLRASAIVAPLFALAACSPMAPPSLYAAAAPQPPVAPRVPVADTLPALAARSPMAPPSVDPTAAPEPRAAPGVPVVDTPPWLETTIPPKVTLTWVRYPERAIRHPSSDAPTVRRAELVVRVGAVERHIVLGDFKGESVGSSQHFCAGRHPELQRQWGRDVVAQIEFVWAGSEVVSVRRSPAGALMVSGSSVSDGVCDGDCVMSERPLAVVPIPADARIEEAMVDVEGPGREHPFECD